MSLRTLQRALLLVIASMTVAGAARAQTPTAEGTKIINTASATYTDGGTGSYSASTADTVTVGFKASITVVDTATKVPASPSTGNTYSWTLTNNGNGVDTVSFAVVVPAGITVTQYRIGASTYADLPSFQAAIAQYQLAANGTAGNSVTIGITYTVAASLGGTTKIVTIDGTSKRDATAKSGSSLTIKPASVAVTPDNSAIDRAPGSYSATYTITNNAPVAITYTLSAGATGSVATAGAITGTGVSGGAITIAAGGNADVDVAYTVSNSSTLNPNDKSTLSLTATSTGAGIPSINDGGSYVVNLLRPKLAMLKEAYKVDQTTKILSGGAVAPGDTIWYKISVNNGGNTSASAVKVDDAFPAQLTFTLANIAADVVADDTTLPVVWDFSTSTAAKVTGTLSSLGSGATRFFWIRTVVK